MPIKRSPFLVPLGRAKGKSLQAIHVYEADGSLNIDLRFDADLALELSFHSSFQATARLLKWVSGNSQVVRTIRPRRER